MAIRDLIPRRFRGRRLPVWRRRSAPVDFLHREVNRLFEDFFRGFPWEWAESLGEPRGSFFPRLDVTEDEDKITVWVELPGVDEKDLEVSLSPGVLTIRGEKHQEHESERGGYYRLERAYGCFERAVPIPCEIEEDRVEADFKRGVLRITLPKTAAARAAARHIPVRRVA